MGSQPAQREYGAFPDLGALRSLVAVCKRIMLDPGMLNTVSSVQKLS